ncbi:MAG: hypothetical protein HOH43_02540 [Candidatus Latescibacteria bacterium]|jgi:hypothetical protein|nr:hypothetical protein [Candidatus Latescibacterota bacterium]
MVFETLIAASIYTGAITYLHHDGPPTLTVEAQANTAIAETYQREDNHSNSSTQDTDIDPADLRGESIWAKDDGKFEDWAK